LRLRLYVAGDLLAEAHADEYEAAIVAGQHLGRAAYACSVARVPWVLECYRPELPPGERFDRFGSDFALLVELGLTDFAVSEAAEHREDD
jgi:hypothetical protein